MKTLHDYVGWGNTPICLMSSKPINTIDLNPEPVINCMVFVYKYIKGGTRMIPRNRISVFIVAFLAFGFLFAALPENGYAGRQPVEIGCCQFSEMNVDPVGLDNRLRFYECADETDIEVCNKEGGDFFPDELCNLQTGMCNQVQPTRNVPTLSEWGLITMAAILGVIGFMVIRRRKAAA